MSRSPRPTSPTISTLRRGSRSTHTPAGSVKRRKGRNSTVPSAATAKADACSSLIAMNGRASCEIDEPNWLIVWPVHIFMKSRCDHRAPDGLRIVGLRGPEAGRQGARGSAGAIGGAEVVHQLLRTALKALDVFLRQTRADEAEARHDRRGIDLVRGLTEGDGRNRPAVCGVL